jgi:predicted CXXCH cytochrome family protein
MIRVSGRDYNGVIESPCYKSGKFSCLSCHSLHESEPAGQLSERGRSNRACIQCHENFQEPSPLAAHTHHLPNSSGSECYNCHMPHTTYGVLKAIRSHQISSPRVSVDLATGRPNACNLCHLDKSINWTADRLQEWYKQEKPLIPENVREISHIVRLALSGDGGQRSLAAWHFSWAPALQISQTNWVAPILGQLLDDPYAAVRCLAERSLKQISDLAPAAYDYTINPKTRETAAEKVWNNWKLNEISISETKSQSVLGFPNDLPKQRKFYEEWLTLRDERPIRLRE